MEVENAGSNPVRRATLNTEFIMPYLLYYPAKFPFLTWLFITLISYTGLFWAYTLGFVHIIASTDITGLSTIILALYAFINLYIGYLSWLVERTPDMDQGDKRILEKNMQLPFWLHYALPVLGFTGTVIGLMVLFNTNLNTNVTDLNAVTDLLKSFGHSAGAAIGPTLIGLIASLILSFHIFLLDQSVDN
jgi:hypothetical protein